MRLYVCACRPCLLACLPACVVCCVQYEEMYNRSIQDPNGFWSDMAKEFHWEKQVQCGTLCVCVCEVGGGAC